MNQSVWGLLFLVFGFSVFGTESSNFCSNLYAADIPPSVHGFLVKKGRHDLIARFQAIPALSPEDFTKKFVNTPGQRPLGAGYNGIAFVDNEGRVTKFSFAVLASLGIVQLNPDIARVTNSELLQMEHHWGALRQSPALADVDVPKLRNAKEEPLGSQPLDEELLGSLIWSAYNPRFTPYPDLVSSDGFAFRTPLVQGVTFAQVLRSEREGTALHRRYNMQKLWKQVVFWQQVGHTMLQDSGVTVDLFQPANMLVDGVADATTGYIESPRIELIDHAVARPSPEGYAYYRAHGLDIPEPVFADAVKIIVWPTMPQHIVFNKLWGLNFNQALNFISAFYETQTQEEAIVRLAAVDTWSIVEAPFLGDYSNIEQARKLLANKSTQSAKNNRPSFWQRIKNCINALGA